MNITRRTVMATPFNLPPGLSRVKRAMMKGVMGAGGGGPVGWPEMIKLIMGQKIIMQKGLMST